MSEILHELERSCLLAESLVSSRPFDKINVLKSQSQLFELLQKKNKQYDISVNDIQKAFINSI